MCACTCMTGTPDLDWQCKNFQKKAFPSAFETAGNTGIDIPTRVTKQSSRRSPSGYVVLLKIIAACFITFLVTRNKLGNHSLSSGANYRYRYRYLMHSTRQLLTAVVCTCTTQVTWLCRELVLSMFLTRFLFLPSQCSVAFVFLFLLFCVRCQRSFVQTLQWYRLQDLVVLS